MSKDFLKKYKKQKILNNITIVIASLIIALGINFFVIDNSGLGNHLKANILETKQNKSKADLYLERENKKIILKNSKILNNTKSLSFSLIFNANNIKIKNILCNGNNLIEIGDTPGLKAIIINYNNKTLKKDSKICSISIEKTNNSSEQLNLINSNFTDNTGETYLLTTSGVTF